MGKRQKYTSQKKFHLHKGTAALLLAFLFVVIAGGIVLYQLDHEKPEQDLAKESVPHDMVEVGSVKCTPKPNLETYLFMGIDAAGKVRKVKEYDGTGQADVLILLVIDRTANTYATLPINRDTITAVRSLDEEGNVLATTDIQIALAHANGDGLEESCENTVLAVSQLLCGQKIDGYIALNRDAIAQINHMAGGVTVTIEDDFSDSDKSLKMGQTVKLSDEQAMHYVHDRMNVGDGTNEGRMRRQSAFMKGLEKNIRERSADDETFALSLFDGLKDYRVTNLNGNNISRISKAMLKNKNLGEFHIDGTSAIDDYGFNAFTVNRDSLEQVVRDLFYNKID